MLMKSVIFMILVMLMKINLNNVMNLLQILFFSEGVVAKTKMHLKFSTVVTVTKTNVKNNRNIVKINKNMFILT